MDFAKRQGDILVVGVGTDKTIRELKVPERPINPEKLRMRLIGGLQVVDCAVLLKEQVNKILTNRRSRHSILT